MPSRKQIAIEDGRNLSLARHVARLSQGELARRVGLSPASISRYEAGTRRMTSELKRRLVRALVSDPEPRDPEAA